MRFGLLGAVELRAEDRAISAGGLKQRSLLAVLLLQANKPVSRDRLAAALWEDAPPRSANAALDAYLYRLRRLLGDGRLERRPGGYVLRVEPDELDVEVFERLVAAGRAAMAAAEYPEAARQLAAALGQWRGAALADLADQPFAAGEIARLEEARLGALEDCFDAELAAGRAAELVPRIEQAVAAHPLRERLVAALMLALYRAGRQADALAACRQARRRLIDELGLEPGPAVRELEARMLRHDPALTLRSPAPVGARADEGRETAAVTPDGPGAGRAARLHLVRRRLVGAGAIAAVALLVASLLALRLGTAPAAPVTLDGADGLVALDPASGQLLGAARLSEPLDAVLGGTGSLWAADPESGTVTRRDPVTGAVTDQIATGGEPGGVAASGGSLWVASSVAATVTRIDPVTEGITQVISLPAASLTGITYGDGALWVAGSTARELFEISPGTGAVTRTLPLGLEPSAVLVAAGSVWVAGYDDATLVRIDPATGTVTGRARVGDGPAALTFSGGSVWVANQLDGTVTAVDPRTLRASAPIAVGNGPTALAAAGASVWVASQYSGTVSRIAAGTRRVTATVAVGGDPTALTTGGGRLWAGVTADGRAHRGGTLTIVTSNDMAAPGLPPLTAVDPAVWENANSTAQFLGLAYDNLLSFDETAGADGTLLVPDLAQSLPRVSGGGTSFTFRLRAGIRYSDGEPLRASDFRRGLERLYRIGSPQVADFSELVGAAACQRHPATCGLSQGVVTDDRSGTVTFRLTQSDPEFPYTQAANGPSVPVPPGYVAGTATGATSRGFIPGTGPYRLAFASDTEVRFTRNPYFREWSHAAQPAGYPDAVTWRTVAGNAAAVTEIEHGAADWLQGPVPQAQYRQLTLAHPELLHSSPEFAVEFLSLNTNIAPFNNAAARQALNYAIDRNKVEQLYGGPAFATPTCQVITPGLPGYRQYCPYTARPSAGGGYTGPDLARARQLVRQSGTAGDEVDVWGTDEPFIPPTEPAYVAGVLRALGYKVRLHHVSYASLTIPLREKLQLSVDGDWLAGYPDPASYLPAFFSCGASNGNGYYCDPALDREMTQAEQAEPGNPARAAALWTTVDRQLTDTAEWVPTVIDREVEVTSPRLRHYEFNPVLGFLADQAWLR